jgi:hypothetical protein
MVLQSKNLISLVEEETEKLINWVAEVEQSSATIFAKNQLIVTRLGAHYRQDGLTEIGFWTPELMREVMRPRDIYLEVFTPLEKINWRSPQGNIYVRRDCIPLKQRGEFFWGVVQGMQAGTREKAGSFYWLRYLNPYGKIETIRDVMPYSLPYGIFAPAELYDMESLQKNRADLDYFKNTGTTKDDHIPRVPAPTNILQLHVGTASPAGTFEGLTNLYHSIAEKIRKNQSLLPHEENYIGYDAVQLLPVEPTIEYRKEFETESTMFLIERDKPRQNVGILPPMNRIPVKLFKPNTQDWGYDVPILGSSTTNPAILGTLRPDELFDFISVLHNFPPKPIQLIYDIVYGHADNQAELLINRQFLKGPNMYGQDLNHQLPMVRAILLEMQQRKIDTGADGIRIDGGQDFRFFNPLTGRVEQDDQYLLAMSDLVQNIQGYKRQLFTIFEDGRPWPEEGWEEKSTYMDLIELKPDSYQWGPLIFAHNTPAIKGFWQKKWRRICEVMYQGQNWITGCGNHDTLRRGNQVDSKLQVNWGLGETLNGVIRNAYDNSAVYLWVYGFMPGLPMDFINVLMHTPWMFFRNTDEQYGVKVVSEEAGFLDWQITPEFYQQEGAFQRMKSLGFASLAQLREFTHALHASMIEKNYDLTEVVKACQFCFGEDNSACEIEALKIMNRPDMVEFLKKLDTNKLKQWALMFMEDCYEVCNVSHYFAHVNPSQTKYNLSLRNFRHNHQWLNLNLQGTDRFNKIHAEETTIFYGLRTNPAHPQEKIAMVIHLEGEPLEINLLDWLQLDLEDWEIAITTPNLSEVEDLTKLNNFSLSQSQGLLLKHKPQN